MISHLTRFPTIASPFTKGIPYILNRKISMKFETKSLGCVDVVWPILDEGGGGGCAIYRENMAAKFDQNLFSRETPQDLETQINQIWADKKIKNSRLYNGSKFRFGGMEVLDGKCVLKAALTTYKELCGTNLSRNSAAIQERGRTEFGHSQALMSDPIGVGIVLITEDDCLIVTRRASWTGEFPSMLDRPGGHPEPDRVLTLEGALKPGLGDGNINEAVMEEIWTSAAQEAEDEVGIHMDKLDGIRFLGLCVNNISGGRPSLEFFARLKMTSDEVQEIYKEGRQAEADESTALHLIPRNVFQLIPSLLESEIMKETESQLSTKPSAEPAQGVLSSISEALTSDLQGASAAAEPEGKGVHIESREALLLLKEATPGLKAALMLSHLQCLF